MPKITKRVVDSLKPATGRDVFAWDSELRGFGVRVKPSGVKTFLIQYRNVEGRTRRLVLGQYGVLTAEVARDMARAKLAGVAQGEDPSATRHAAREGMLVNEVCDWYLEEAKTGRILGRNRRPIKASTLDMDKSRIETHIKPLLGTRMVSGLTLRDIEGMQADIAAGRSARPRKKGRGGRTTGGEGVAGRTVGTFRSLLGHAVRLGVISANPAEGVRQIAGKGRDRRLSVDELILLGSTMRAAAADGEHPTGLAAIRLILLTGFRRMEALALERPWPSHREHCVRFPDTKGGAQLRVIGEAAFEHLKSIPVTEASSFFFPADWGDGHFVGIVKVIDRICATAGIKGVTPHVLRHTYASIAGDLGFSELTIKGLIGHAKRGVTQGYVHLDIALIVAANEVSKEIAHLLDGKRSKLKQMQASYGRAASAVAA
jgi:integrase